MDTTIQATDSFTCVTCGCDYTGETSATYCNTLQHTATHCTLQHTATHCNTLQHTATHCNTQVKQGGVAVPLKEEAVMEITKVRVINDQNSFQGVRIQTAASSQTSSRANSRPTTRGSGIGGSRPLTRGTDQDSRPTSSLTVPEDEEAGEEESKGVEKGSLDAARLLARAGDILARKAHVLVLRHEEMLRDRDVWFAQRHASQVKEVYICVYIYICMYLYMCVYIYIYIYAYIYIYICIYVYIHIFMYMYASIFIICTSIFIICTCTYIHNYIHVGTCHPQQRASTYIYVHIVDTCTRTYCKYVYIHTYIYMYI